MNILNSNRKVRGLFTALSLALLIAFSMNIAYGETSNELRESLGLTPNNYGISYETWDGINKEPNNNTSENNSNTITEEDKQSNQIIHNTQNVVDVSNLESEIKQLESRLKSRLENSANAYLIVGTIDSIIDIQSDIERALNSKDGYAHDSLINISKPSYSEDAALEDTETVETLVGAGVEQAIVDDINSLNFEIGGIGSRARSVVESTFRLVTPYGFTKHASEDAYTKSKLLGMELYAPIGGDIVSQWNGVVVGTYSDISSGAQTIKIYHGNSTYTVYSHVYPVNGIYVGTVVRTGEVIAKAADTSKSEPDKDNHILYQIKLNGEFINPLTIYGSRGKQIYEKWLTTTSYDNVVEVGEIYYNDLDESFRYEYDASNDPPTIKFPDYNVEIIEPEITDDPIDEYEPIMSIEEMIEAGLIPQ